MRKMPRSREQNEALREERRQAILQAAEEVFARLGLAPAKIADIAKAAGMSYGLVYHYFGTKEAVFAALVERAAHSTSMLVQYLSMRPGTPLERLAWLTQVMVEGVRQHPARMAVMLEALTKEMVAEGVRQMARRSNDQLRAAVQELLAAGQQSGEVAAGDPAAMANLYLSLMNGIATTVLAERPAAPGFPEVKQILRSFQA
jgi:AcrR family transcriptional regulator